MATLWDMSSGQVVHQMEHGTRSGDRAYVVAFSPDGRYLATGGYDDRSSRFSHFSSHKGNTVLWDVNSGRKVQEIEWGWSEVEAVFFSSDGQYLVSAYSYLENWTETHKRVFLLNIGSSRQFYYELYGTGVNAVAFSPDGKYLAVGNGVTTSMVSSYGSDTVFIDSISDFKTVQRIEHTGLVNTVAFSPDGKYLVTGGYLRRGEDQGVVTLWEVIDAPIQEPGQSIRQIKHKNHVHLIAFSPDGKYLAVMEHGGTITFYQIPEEITITTKIAAEKTIRETGDTDLAWSSCGRFISDSKKVYRVLLEP